MSHRNPQQRDPANDQNSAHRDIAKWTRWVATFTLVLAAATIISTYFIYEQYSIANQAQVDFREQSRAVITSVGGVIATEKTPESKIVRFLFSPKFHNFGGTRTSTFKGWFSVHYFPGNIPESQDFSKPWDKVDIPNSIVPAGVDIQFAFVPISDFDAIEAYKGHGSIILWGHINWADLFNRTDIHQIGICLLMQPQPSATGEPTAFEAVKFRAECNYDK